MSGAEHATGPLAGLRVLELADESGQFCGKLMADLGADVVKIEPPSGSSARRIGPFLDDIPGPDRSLSFWYYNTSKRALTLDLATKDGRALFRRLAAGADVLLETLPPGHLAGLGLGHDTLAADNPGLVTCSLTPFGQTGPWRTICRRTCSTWPPAAKWRRVDTMNPTCRSPRAEATPGTWAATTPIWPSWRRWSTARYPGRARDIDVSIHEACALTTESAIANWIYRGEVLKRQTGRHHAAGPTPRTQFLAKDGRYVCALISGGLNPRNVKQLAELMDQYGMAGDLKDPKYQDPAVVAASASHIIDGLLADFIASLPSEEVYHAGQQRGFTWRWTRGRGPAGRPASARSWLLEAGGTSRTRPQLHLSG